MDTADALADLDEDLISARDWLAQSFKLADDPKRAKLEALEDPDLAPLWRKPD